MFWARLVAHLSCFRPHFRRLRNVFSFLSYCFFYCAQVVKKTEDAIRTLEV